MNRNMIQGDVREVLEWMPDDHFDTIITSPPYYNLRNYDADKQIGTEKTVQEYIDKLVTIMDECRDTLKPTGSLWVNIGDTYNHPSGKWESKGEYKVDRPAQTQLGRGSRMGVPERFMVAMIDDGWILRNHVIWHKPNRKPSSAKDRFTQSYESIFFFTAQSDYYFNMAPVMVPRLHPLSTRHRPDKRQQSTLDGNTDALHKTLTIPKYRADSPDRPSHDPINRHRSHYDKLTGKLMGDPLLKRPDDVWEIMRGDCGKYYVPTGHFAPFPVEIPHKIISCACPPGGRVLDPFMGSGTTAISAELLQREWVGIELNQKYVDEAKRRVRPFIEQTVIT